MFITIFNDEMCNNIHVHKDILNTRCNDISNYISGYSFCLHTSQRHVCYTVTVSPASTVSYTSIHDVIGGDGTDDVTGSTSESMWQLVKRHKVTMGMLTLAMFFTGCGFSMIAPFFPE